VAPQQDPAAIKSAIRQKYAEVAVSAAGKFQYPTGREGAELLGYDRALIQSAPPQLLDSFCGVGNPFSLGEIRSGSVVLDVGCGAGFDLYIADRLVGDQGRVCGIDLTDEMASLAKKNLAKAGTSDVEIKTVDMEHIPYPDHTFDVVISNGVINLSPSKEVTFKEIYRVLKPGGTLQFADVVLEQDLPSELSGSADAWAQ
jgi:SAM-dependent methyltransferase